VRGNYQPSISAGTVNSRLMAVASRSDRLALFWTEHRGGMARPGCRQAREDAFNRLLDGALLDPETAAMLLREQDPANRAAMQWVRTTILTINPVRRFRLTG
jgi:hypothetical protein